MSLVLSIFPGFGMGGAQARFCAVANHHGPALRHAIVAMNRDLSCSTRLRMDLDVRYPEVTVRPGDLLGNVGRFAELLRRVRPDVLLTHNFGSIEWALAALLPGWRGRHVHVEDGFGPEERERQLPRRVWVRRLALRRAVVALPSRVLLRLARTVWRLDGKRLRYVPNGVDLARFAPAPPAAAEAGVVVGTVAGLRPEKNVARLLHAVAQVPEVRLVVVGDGPERPALTALAQSLGLSARVTFPGLMENPEHAYRRMNIFALSSDTEQMPLSLLEAMAAGLPVAATDVGDVAGIVAPENRRFVVPRDAAALAAALRALVMDAGLRRTLGAVNRAKVAEEFDQARMFATWGELMGA